MSSTSNQCINYLQAQFICQIFFERKNKHSIEIMCPQLSSYRVLSFILILIFYVVCVCVCVCAHALMCASATRPEESVRFLGSRLTGSCELPYGDGKNLGPLGEQSVLFC